MIPEYAKPKIGHLYLDSILLIKEKIAPHTPAFFVVLSVALSIFCLIVPNVYSPIIFKVTIVTLVTYGSSLTFCFITPYLPDPLQMASKHVQLFVKELVAVLFFAAIYFVDLSKDNIQLPEKTSDPFIIFVPGYLHNSSGAVKIKSEIEKETGISVKCINSNSLFGSIVDRSKSLGLEIEKIRKEIGQRKIILIGHSMGGLVALNYALKDQGEKSDIDSVMTISSPSKGTPMAYIGAGQCAKEMLPHSEFIDQLNLKSKHNLDCQLLQIGLKHDIIVPLQSAFLEDIPDENTYVIENVGHLDILLSDDMIAILIDEIKNPSSKVNTGTSK